MKKASILMIIGSMMLLGLFIFPMWNIRLGAPQYPDPLGIDIHVNGLKGESEFDIQNIDGLNHYIGMKTLPKPEEMWEFSVFPKVVLAMAALGVLIGVLGYLGKIRPIWFFIWFLLMGTLGALGIYDFNLWLVAYGTDLDPNAILKLVNPDGTPMQYNPPLIGHKKLLNFDAFSYPRMGGILLGIGMMLTAVAYFIGKKSQSKNNSRAMKNPGIALMIFLVSLFVTSCHSGPEPIHYGEDACDFCRMTIVDKQHAAQVVTEKGRVYKYDAIECMLNDLKDWDRPAIKYHLVADYQNPGQLTDALKASYLITDKIPSPMGAYLTAFATTQSRAKIHDSVGGQTLEWPLLQNKFEISN
ncbi:MAG: nitrous oxide reductase accessory protein NosL [Marinoscillum sp.]|uniref:nitrous oxide reductase accessory protein NosL n=1 Tax=Marinoscillum sp. TaxID=2024838 RepID=UPI0032F4DB16